MSEDPLPAFPPAQAEPPPLPPAPGGGEAPAARAPRGPLLGFIIDGVLSTVVLLFTSTILIVAVMLPSLMSTGDGANGKSKSMGMDVDALMDSLMPQVTVAAVLAMLVTAVVVWLVRGRGMAAMPRTLSTGKAYGLAILSGLGIQAFAWLVSMAMHQLESDIQPSNAEPLVALSNSTPWLAWLMVVVVGPFAEELLFRRVLLHRFAVAGRGIAGLLLISILFALMHEPVPDQQPVLAWLGALLLYTGMGVGFGAVYLRTGRLGAAFAAHAACNLAAMALMAYSTG